MREAHRSAGEAEAAWSRLQSRHAGVLAGLAPRIERVELGRRGIYYRLYAAPGAGGAAADAGAVCRAVRARGDDCIVARL